jgi:hypothetical protein
MAARNNEGWRRRLLAHDLRQSGMKWREIGAFFGLSGERARQLASMGARMRSHPQWNEEEAKAKYGDWTKERP